METETNKSRLTQEGKITNLKKCKHEVLIKKTLYLEIDASRVSLVAGVLQVRIGKNYMRNETLDNSILQSKGFPGKSLSPLLPEVEEPKHNACSCSVKVTKTGWIVI